MIEALGQGQKVFAIAANLDTPEAVLRVAQCDVVFGCVDGAESRHLINRLAAYYILPYVDVGVQLVSDGKAGIEIIAGAVHYVQPWRVVIA